MQRSSLLRVSVFCALLLGGLLIGPADAQTRRPSGSTEAIRIISPDERRNDEVADVLLRGQKFEAEARWGEAITLYEEALREHPQDRELSGRHDLAKIHYDLSRRYHDASFLKSLATLPTRDAMTLFSEVLTKIQTHYVTEPNWKALVARGMQDLRVAARDESFVKQNFIRRPSDGELEAGLRKLDEVLAARVIRNRQDAEAAVSMAAQVAQNALRLPMAATYFEFTCAAAGSLDEYSSYLTPEQLNEVYSQIDGNFVGLGIELKAADGALQIVKVITGSPAEKAGLKGGDRITAVDGRATAE
jgi:carboxyl-terminal processing protease